LAKGSQTQTNEFKLNISGPYEIEVEADRNRNIPFNVLTCSLGAGPMWPQETCSSPSILKMTWVLTSDGKVVARGSSDETTGGGSSSTSVMRTIGSFQGQRSHLYQLTVNSLADASDLAAATPRLKVDAEGGILEFDLVMSGLISSTAAGIALIGAILVLASLLVHHRRTARTR
jgi:hypothetical protein